MNINRKRIAAEHLPAVPLITCDPYFNLWSGSDMLYDTDTMHWTGRRKRITGTAKIDGVEYRFLGMGEEPVMEQIQLTVTAIHSIYRFSAAGIELSLDFWTPLLLDDLDVMSRPCSYLDMALCSQDGKRHEVELVWEFDGELCCDRGQTEKIGGGRYILEEMCSGEKKQIALQTAWMGLRQQSPLGHSGDSLAIDWGYLYLAAQRDRDVNVEYRQRDRSLRAKALFHIGETGWKSAFLIAAYDDMASINYFGHLLPGYWAREGKNIHDAISEAFFQHDILLERCSDFEHALEKETLEFGEAYTKICFAAYRQSIAAHKLIADEKGNPAFISKECHSGGFAVTVDVTYPSTPLFFCYNPELVRGMMRPVLRFAKLPVWGYDFAPHDVGSYPYVTGQLYGLNLCQNAAQDARVEDTGNVCPMFWQMPGSAQLYDLRYQMPIEECGNLLILEAMLAKCSPEQEREVLAENLPLYEKWVKYLLKYGIDPGEQLCTDDFAGHLAHNVNLAIKAVMGIEAYSILMEIAGKPEETEKFHKKAQEMAKEIYNRANAGDHTKLTFDGEQESWSLKYNAVWDLVFGSGLWPEEFYCLESGLYQSKCNTYGIPLDSRESYGKSDWMMWAAALDFTGKAVEKVADCILEFLEKSPDRVPFSDFYMTQTGRQHIYRTSEGRWQRFQNRTVQGGIFMPLLLRRLGGRIEIL